MIVNAIYRNAFLSIWEADLHKYELKSPFVHSHFPADSAVTGCHAASSVQGGFSMGADWWGDLDWAGWADPGKWPPDQFQDPQNQAYEANLWKLLRWGLGLDQICFIFYPFCFSFLLKFSIPILLPIVPILLLSHLFCFSSRVMLLMNDGCIQFDTMTI